MWIQSVWVPKTMSWRKHNKLTRNDTAGIQLKQHSCSSKLHLYFSWNAYFAFVKKNENKKRNDGRFFLRPPATSTVWFVSLQLFVVVVASWDGIFVAGLLRLASQNDDFVRNLVPGHQVTHTVPVLFTWAQTMSQTMYLVPLNCCHYLLPVHRRHMIGTLTTTTHSLWNTIYLGIYHDDGIILTPGTRL